jgi:hypothetical protein
VKAANNVGSPVQGDLPLSRDVASRLEGNSSSRKRPARRPRGTRSLIACETATALQHSSDANINSGNNYNSRING